MIAETYEKTANGVLSYTLDWADWLGTDTISLSAWTVPTGITNDAATNTTTTTTITLSSGTAGSVYVLRNHVTTAAGLEEDGYLVISCVADPSSSAYCTAYDVRQQLAIGTGTETISATHEDAIMTACVTVSRLIDRYKTVNDNAYNATTSADRYFDGTGDDELFIPPAVSISAVAVEETDGTFTSWDSTDYVTWPYNSTPIRAIYVSDRTTGTKSYWHEGPKRVKLTGVWGVSATVPDLVRQACATQVAIWYKRMQAGWATREGSAEFGFISYPKTLDQDVRMMLDSVDPRVTAL